MHGKQNKQVVIQLPLFKTQPLQQITDSTEPPEQVTITSNFTQFYATNYRARNQHKAGNIFE